MYKPETYRLVLGDMLLSMHIAKEPACFCLAKQVLKCLGIKLANMCKQALKPLGSYMRVLILTVWLHTFIGVINLRATLILMNFSLSCGKQLGLQTTSGERTLPRVSFGIGARHAIMYAFVAQSFSKQLYNAVKAFYFPMGGMLVNRSYPSPPPTPLTRLATHSKERKN